MTLKLGIIGLSDGNGHPYSWSAIFNGYDRAAMQKCGFPVIPGYLDQQSWPESRISDAAVTTVWTQNEMLSNKIAKAALIPEVVSKPTEMIGKVDAVLLARDDAESHLELAKPFLEAGLPIYIDKPIALTIKDLNKLYELEQYSGQIFTCSALRYSKELSLSQKDRLMIGEIRSIVAFTPKSWAKYAVHIIEPVLKMLPESDTPSSFTSRQINPSGTDGSGSLLVQWNSGVQTALFATGDAGTPISIRVMGSTGYKDLCFSDSFSAFKAALASFLQGVKERTVASPRNFNQLVVELIERGAQ